VANTRVAETLLEPRKRSNTNLRKDLPRFSEDITARSSGSCLQFSQQFCGITDDDGPVFDVMANDAAHAD
jgi:hypothetical protein